MAEKHLDRAYALFEDLKSLRRNAENKKLDFNFEEEEIDCNIGFGNLYRKKGDLKKADEYLKNSLTLCQKYFSSPESNQLPENGSIGKVYNAFGVLYDTMGKYSESEEFYFKSLKIRKNLFNNLDTAITYNNLGSLYYNDI